MIRIRRRVVAMGMKENGGGEDDKPGVTEL